jgi:signal transduction histidine kinase
VVLYKLVKQKTCELEGKNLELTESNNTKDKLFTIIGHDLRNPVAALSTLADLLQTNHIILSEKDKSHIIDHIQASSNALKLLVNNLLDWALVHSKHLDPHPTIVETRKAAEECFKLVKLSAHNKNILLENLCAESHYVFVDPNMFHTILRNIISNSIKFTPKDGKITVESIELGHDKILVNITDTGIGMSQQKIDELFFNQKLTSTAGTANEKGSGLGLVVVKEFVEVNKGYLSITSSPEEGTKFMIQLPMMQYFE